MSNRVGWVGYELAWFSPLGDGMEDHLTISVKDAYRAMLAFLDGAYERTQSDDLAGLLGDWQLTTEGGTMDPAAWGDWLAAIERVRRHNSIAG